ncbi:MAG: aminodeoxychorismate synthase component I [Bacteroidales bacterium]|nr:aminodeoxychorismate synthase component I [Bacteroidales bacterium]
MSRKSTIKEQMNEWAGAGIPFLFIIDFEQVKPLIFRLDEINPEILLYDINGISNSQGQALRVSPVKLARYPESYADYLVKFNLVMNEIALGNSFLLNLTCSTPVDLNSTLLEIFHMSTARYKIWLNDEFVCFSPEPFIKISEGKIRSYPMKGTIDASIPDAENVILNDPKETAEHYTIVDLIRNDLSMVSQRVRVERFRYFDTLETNEKRLLQVSSEVCGDLEEGFAPSLGDIIFSLLPAGSVSGAPKKMTTEIIASAEGMPRGYYTGIAGIFDGHSLDSGVLIRFIEKRADRYFYRSGGGVTSFSDPLSEYIEMIDKIYVPVI